jgi:hypothetical protein
MREEQIVGVDRNRAMPLYCQVCELLEEMIKRESSRDSH